MGKYVGLALETIHRYGLAERSDQIATCARLLQIGEMGESEAEMLLLQLEPWARRQERKPNFLSRAPDFDEIYPNGQGDLIRIGQLVERPDVPIGVRPTDPLTIVVAGTPGSGKTILIRRTVINIDESNKTADMPICLLIFDRKGDDYSDLPGLLGEGWMLWDLFESPLIGFNAQEGVPPHLWVQEVVSNFCATTNLRYGGVTLAAIMRWLLGELNSRPVSKLLWPDWQLLLDAARKLPKRMFSEKGEYLASLCQMLEGAVAATENMSKTFNGLDIDRDLVRQGKSAVIRMPNIKPPWLQSFLTYLLVSQVLVGRMYRGERTSRVNLLIVIDEADAVVAQKLEGAFDDGFSPISRLLRQGREFGIGLCLGVGSLGPVAQHVLNSCRYHFIMRMQHSACRIEASRTLDLPRGADAIIPKLEPGEALVRTPYWSDAALAQIDSCPPNRTAPRQFDVLPVVPSKRLSKMPELLRAIDTLRTRQKEKDKEAEREQHAKLDQAARQLLAKAAEHPYWPVARLYDLMEANVPKATRLQIRKHLIDSEYARFETVKQGRKQQDLIDLTDKAWQLFGKPPIKLGGRGFLPHRTYSHWIAMVARRQGHLAEIEWVVPGTNHPVDVAVKRDDHWHVYELVVDCEENLPGHLRAIFSSDSPVVAATIVALTKKKLSELRRRIESHSEFLSIRHRILYEVVGAFERELWPE